MTDIVNEYLEKTRSPMSGIRISREMLNIRPRIVCADGFDISVQAGWTHYCTPRINDGPYSHVEVGYPSEVEELLLPYQEDDERQEPTEDVYPFTPVDIVVAVIKKHGGIADD